MAHSAITTATPTTIPHTGTPLRGPPPGPTLAWRFQRPVRGRGERESQEIVDRSDA